jgi:serine/threonine protein kinase
MNDRPGDELFAGKVIAGRFRLERPLGQGGMGAIWVGRHLSLNVEVALKFIDLSSAKRRAEIASRFEQEAQAAAKVKGPHVVNVLDYGSDEAGRAFIAMELLQGEELARRLERGAPMPVDEVCRVVAHAARGLQRAHAAGIVHRDLKPENLFLVDDDDGFVVKVLDFGIAKANSPVGAVTPHTDPGQILGTPLYMSPEQALGVSAVDYRSDLYSLAVVAFRCLTGSVPFYSKALGQLIVKVSTEPVPSARALRPDLPPGVDAWFERAMHKDPARRFASAREMAEQFARACELSAGAAPAPSPSAPTSEQPLPPTVRSEELTITSPAASGAEMAPPTQPAPAASVPVPPSRRAAFVPEPPSRQAAPGPPSGPAAGEADTPLTVAKPAASRRRESPALDASNETLLGAAATYVPPSPRPWFHAMAAAGLMVFLVGSVLALATRPFGSSGLFASRHVTEHTASNTLSAGAFGPLTAPLEAPPPAASLAPAKPKRPAARPKPQPDPAPRKRVVSQPAAASSAEAAMLPTPVPSTPTPVPSTPTPAPNALTPTPNAPLPAPNAPLPAPNAPLPAPNAPLPSRNTPLPTPNAPPPTPAAEETAAH